MRRLIVRTPAGSLEVRWAGRILGARFCEAPPSERLPARLREALRAYWRGEKHDFSALVELPSRFRSIYAALLEVPPGQTVTYAALSRRVFGSARRARLVGKALHENPIPFFIPCHRVCGARNPLAYRWGENRKRQLLEFEQKQFGGGHHG